MTPVRPRMRSGPPVPRRPLALALLLLAALAVPAACGAGRAAAPAPDSPCVRESPRPPAEAGRVRVRRVVDGDTFVTARGERVRLLGVNTPESVDPRRPVQRYGKEAAAFSRRLLGGRSVLLAPGRTPRDRYGRTLAWVWLEDGRFVNAELVRLGYAQVYTFPDNPDHARLLVLCQREAREAGRGLWGGRTP